MAALAGEPAASKVEAELRRGGAGITAVNLAEVIDQLVGPARGSQPDVDTTLASLVAGELGVIPVDEPIGRLAGGLRARHYDQRNTPISLADCVALAASCIRGATLATADPSLAAVAKRTGVKVLGLPDQPESARSGAPVPRSRWRSIVRSGVDSVIQS